MGFEILPHTADLKLKISGSSKADLFRNALRGMFETLHPKPAGTPSPIRIVHVQSPDINALLVDFLSEALTLSDINDEAYLDANITKLHTPGNVAQTLRACPELVEGSSVRSEDLSYIEAELHGIKIKGFEGDEIKAVTHHEVDIKKVGDKWEAEIIFDI